jgi:hypothetical protein
MEGGGGMAVEGDAIPAGGGGRNTEQGNATHEGGTMNVEGDEVGEGRSRSRRGRRNLSRARLTGLKPAWVDELRKEAREANLDLGAYWAGQEEDPETELKEEEEEHEATRTIVAIGEWMGLSVSLKQYDGFLEVVKEARRKEEANGMQEEEPLKDSDNDTIMGGETPGRDSSLNVTVEQAIPGGATTGGGSFEGKNPVASQLLPQRQLDTAKYAERLTKVENIIGYRFRNKGLLLEALTHASMARVGFCYQASFFRSWIGDTFVNFLKMLIGLGLIFVLLLTTIRG